MKYIIVYADMDFDYLCGLTYVATCKTHEELDQFLKDKKEEWNKYIEEKTSITNQYMESLTDEKVRELVSHDEKVRELVSHDEKVRELVSHEIDIKWCRSAVKEDFWRGRIQSPDFPKLNPPKYNPNNFYTVEIPE